MRRGRDVLLSIGSNVRPEIWVPRCLALLRARFEVVAVSPAYDVPAVGRVDQPPFVNLALRVRTDLAAPALRAACRHVEERCARRRSGDRYAPRTLDVDPVYAAGEAAHPDLAAEAYVLVPGADAWPDAQPAGWSRTLRAEAEARFPGWRAAHRREAEDPHAS